MALSGSDRRRAAQAAGSGTSTTVWSASDGGSALGRAGGADALQVGEGGGVGAGGGIVGRAGQPHEADGRTRGGVAAVTERVREAGRDGGLAVAGQGGGDEDASHGGMIATGRTRDASGRRCRRAGMGV